MEGPTEIWCGDGLLADESVLLGYPSTRSATTQLTMGDGARLRSGTVIYAGSRIGDGFETGHNVVIREGSSIGDNVSVWSNSVVDYGVTIGNRVKIHSNCYVSQFSELEDDAFLAPGVTLANDLFPGDSASAEAMSGPRICKGAQIGVNVSILPYVTIGPGAIIGAGSTVTRNIPGGTIAYGCPARPVASVPPPSTIAERVRRAQEERLVILTGQSVGSGP